MNKTLQNILKQTGIKMGKYDNIKNQVYSHCLMALKMLELAILEAESENMTNEQFFLDFLDSCNEWSVKY